MFFGNSSKESELDHKGPSPVAWTCAGAKLHPAVRYSEDWFPCAACWQDHSIAFPDLPCKRALDYTCEGLTSRKS